MHRLLDSSAASLVLSRRPRPPFQALFLHTYGTYFLQKEKAYPDLPRSAGVYPPVQSLT
jgi:hypothetical protein